MSPETMLELQRALGRVEGKLDQVIETHEKRISSLEVKTDEVTGWKRKMEGAYVALTVVVFVLFGIRLR